MSGLHWTTEDGVKVFENENVYRLLYPQQLTENSITEYAEDWITFEPSQADGLFRSWEKAKQREGDGWELFWFDHGDSFLKLSFKRTRPLTAEERNTRECWIKEYTEAGGIIVDSTRPASLKRQVPFEQGAQPLTEGEATPDPIWNINNV